MVTRTLRQKMLRDLKGMRAQVITIGALISCGVALLVSTWSAFNSLKSSRDHYYRDYRFADIFSDFKKAPLRVADKVSSLPGVDAIQPRIVIEGLIHHHGPRGEEPSIGRFISIPEGRQPALNQLFLRRGRLPIRGDRIEVLLHEGYASTRHIELGAELQIQIQGTRELVKVVGIALSPEYVVAVSPAAPLPDDQRFGIVWIPTYALERLSRMDEAFNNIAISLSAPRFSEGVKSQVDELLRPYGSRGAYGRDRQSSSMFVEDEIKQNQSTAIISPALFLSIAAFLVHVVASRLIAMQRSQIATLKAIGYTNWEVSTHYFALISLMMVVGAVPGIVLGRGIGLLIAESYERFFRFPSLNFSLSFSAVGIGLLAAWAPGLIGAWNSIRIAFRLAPAEAMRPPAPPVYHSSLLEKFHLQKHLAVPQRMVWRNLLLTPVRMTMTITGLAMAACVVIASMAWVDILDFVLDTQFQRIQREDLSITFVSPVPRGGLRELTGLPGVVAVEGYRSIPVRIQYKNFKRELLLTGRPESASMREQLTPELKKVPLPSQGVLLSRFFEKRWGLKAGQWAEIEVLEGKPRTIPVLIGGFTDDLVGISASMRIDNLWETLSEQPSYSLATVLIDPRSASSLYVRLKEMPNVASVNLKSALYRGFKESIGGVVRVMSGILISFALVIAGGVIYNTVRVSFSERSWELASLRVIGFSQRKIFRLLMAEVGIQVLISLAPGCLLGLGLTHLILNAVHTETFGFPVVILPRTYATGILTVLAALAISSIMVLRLMQRLSLVEALKARE